MFIELHILQNFAPSCLNRDDMNTPKECEFGGHRRARVSSQCLKRAIRWHPEFAEKLHTPMGIRTKRLVAALGQQLIAAGYDSDIVYHVATRMIEEAVAQVGDDNRTRVLTYMGSDELERLRSLITKHWALLAPLAREQTSSQLKGTNGQTTIRKEPDALRGTIRQLLHDYVPGTMAPDIALFGRMIAENAHLNVDAACQVAHAVSTHRVSFEMDFFTAVDDLKSSRRGNAEMIGNIEFCSACYYRYAVVVMEQLVHNLDSDHELAQSVLRAFLNAAILALPSGRQNASAAHNLPSFIMTVVRDSGGPCSLVNAFETPVWVSNFDRLGLVARSINALDTHWGDLVTAYGDTGIRRVATCWLGRAETRHLQFYRLPGLQQVINNTLEAI